MAIMEGSVNIDVVCVAVKWAVIHSCSKTFLTLISFSVNERPWNSQGNVFADREVYCPFQIFTSDFSDPSKLVCLVSLLIIREEDNPC